MHVARRRINDMKIAVTYDHGTVFQHFGRTEAFKIYEIENGEVVSSAVISTEGTGHEALAGWLAGKGVEVLICGGMGEGAKNALDAAGIRVFSGASGDADQAVASYLRDELTSQDVNCDHHHEEEQGCGGCCDSGCDSASCGGCCAPEIIMEGPNAGKTVRVHYRGTFNDGTQFDSSYDRGQPLEFICGTGMMIRGFDRAVLTMKPGEITDVHLMPEEAYGPADPDQILTIGIESLPGSEDLSVGEHVVLYTPQGPVRVLVKDKTETDITFDANHEMAGKELNFRIELVEIL